MISQDFLQMSLVYNLDSTATSFYYPIFFLNKHTNANCGIASFSSLVSMVNFVLSIFFLKIIWCNASIIFVMLISFGHLSAHVKQEEHSHIVFELRTSFLSNIIYLITSSGVRSISSTYGHPAEQVPHCKQPKRFSPLSSSTSFASSPFLILLQR